MSLAVPLEVGGVEVSQEGLTALAGLVCAFLGGTTVSGAIEFHMNARDTERPGSYWHEYFARVAEALLLLWSKGGEDLCCALSGSALLEEIARLVGKKENDEAAP